jgi:hypothetical protein
MITKLFAYKENDKYRHFYPSTKQVEMCIDPRNVNGKIVKVDVEPDPDGEYWGWLNTGHYGKEGTISFLYSSKVAVEMCFVYGPKIETELGRGEIVRVSVKES